MKPSKLKETVSHYHMQGLHHQRHQTSIDDLLDLGVLPGSDVGQGPGSLLLDVALVVTQESGEHGQGASIEHTLGLLVRPRYNVPHSPQRWSLGRENKQLSWGQGRTDGHTHIGLKGGGKKRLRRYKQAHSLGN